MRPPDRLTNNADLLRLQQTMAEALMQPLTAKDGLKKATPADFIKPNQVMSGFERLEIYARQYWFRLLDCLYDDYPALRMFLGEKRFHKLCREYLAAHPSTSWTLRNLGQHLPSFVTEVKARDVARVEWAQTLAFDEPLKKALRLDELLGSDPSTLRLGLQPCVVLVRTDYAVDHFITEMKKTEAEVRGSASQAMTEAPERESLGRAPRLKAECVHLAVHRHDNTLYFKRMTREAFSILTHLEAGHCLADAIEAALADASGNVDWAAEIQMWFAEWSQLGWFCRPRSQSHSTRL